MGITTSVRLPPVHPFTGMDLSSALAERANRHGDKAFLVWDPPGHAGRTWSYAEFATDVEHVAAGLHARGVQRGDAVMLLLENSPAFLLCWFACARLGAVAVDANTRYANDELRYALDRTQAVGIVTHQSRVDELGDLRDAVPWLATIDDASGTCPDLMADASALTARPPDPGTALCVQFTSGTTSRPKAVLLTHANALWAAKVGSAHAGLAGDDVTLVYAPLFHTSALSWQTLTTFWVGGTVVLLPRYSASRFWDVAIAHRCTNTNLLGIMLHTLGDKPVPPHHFRMWQFGLAMPDVEARYRVPLFNAWGMTEVVTHVIVNDRDYPTEAGAIGRVATEYQVKIARPDGSDAGVGEVGDLRVRGVRGLSVFAEYFGDPAATTDAFDDDGYFHTGDKVVLLPSGAIRFAGRAKDMLKVGGENVAAGEIERVLSTVDGITAAAVVGRPDPALDMVPVAFVVVDGGADVDAVRQAAFDACATQLADFKRPRRVYVIDEIPTALLGKVAKGQLTDHARQLQLTEAAGQ